MPASWPPPGEDDGPFPGEEQRSLQVAQVAESLGLRQVPDHHGEGFGHPAFAPAQGLHRLIMSGVGGQVEAAQALDGHDLRLGSTGRGRDGVPGPGGGPLLPARLGGRRPGRRWARRGSAGPRVLIFGPAGGAHGEDGHGGVAAVIGDLSDDGKAGAAVGAIGKGIMVAAVAGVDDFGKAGVAGGDVGGNQGLGGGLVLALQDGKAGLALGSASARLPPPRPGQSRGLVLRSGEQIPPGRRRAFHFDFHAGGGVADPAGQAMQPGQPVDEGPEADALHHAGDL